MEPTTSRRQFLLGLAGASCAAALTLTGCGSGGHATSKARGATVNVRVAFPTAAARVIPTATRSVVIAVTSTGPETTESHNSLTKTLDPTSPTFSFSNVSAGDITVSAKAYDAANGAGTVVATGSATLTGVANGAECDASFSLVATPTSVVVTWSNTNVQLDATITATAVAYDADNAVVLVADAGWSWSSSSETNATVAFTGASATVTGVALGETTITTTATANGSTASTTSTITVVAVDNVIDHVTLTAPTTQKTVSNYAGLDSVPVVFTSASVTPLTYTATAYNSANVDISSTVTSWVWTWKRLLFDSPLSGGDNLQSTTPTVSTAAKDAGAMVGTCVATNAGGEGQVVFIVAVDCSLLRIYLLKNGVEFGEDGPTWGLKSSGEETYFSGNIVDITATSTEASTPLRRDSIASRRRPSRSTPP